MRLPRHLPFAVGPIKKASASASACAVLTESGAVGVWGYGILGLGPNVDTLSEPKVRLITDMWSEEFTYSISCIDFLLRDMEQIDQYVSPNLKSFCRLAYSA